MSPIFIYLLIGILWNLFIFVGNREATNMLKENNSFSQLYTMCAPLAVAVIFFMAIVLSPFWPYFMPRKIYRYIKTGSLFPKDKK